MTSDEAIRKWGTWLRAPSRRVVGQERSKWLRDERDEDWGVTYGNANYWLNSAEETPVGKGNDINSRSDSRMGINKKAIISGSTQQIGSSSQLAANSNYKAFIRPNNEEFVGLNIEELKRRCGLSENEYMEIEGGNGLVYSETTLSNTDCVVFSPEMWLRLLCKLAIQNECSKLELSRVGEPSNISSS